MIEGDTSAVGPQVCRFRFISWLFGWISNKVNKTGIIILAAWSNPRQPFWTFEPVLCSSLDSSQVGSLQRWLAPSHATKVQTPPVFSVDIAAV
jgi:hypothetical protein